MAPVKLCRSPCILSLSKDELGRNTGILSLSKDELVGSNRAPDPDQEFLGQFVMPGYRGRQVQTLQLPILHH